MALGNKSLSIDILTNGIRLYLKGIYAFALMRSHKYPHFRLVVEPSTISRQSHKWMLGCGLSLFAHRVRNVSYLFTLGNGN